jgi:hypothetical protein
MLPVFIYFLFYRTVGTEYFGITETLTYSAGVSFLSSILIIQFRRISWYWAAIAGTLLSIFFYFLIILFGEL